MSDTTNPDPQPSARTRLEGKTSGAPVSGLAGMFDQVNNASAAIARMKQDLVFPKMPDPMAGLRDFTREQHALLHQVVHTPDPNRETARYTRQQADAMAQLLAENARQREENERKDAERDEREQRAPDAAEKSHKIAMWSLVVAILALIAAVVVPLFVG